MGTTYQRGNVWWIRYYHRGKCYRESSHSESETDARRLLKKRIGEMGKGRLIGPREEKVTFEELAQDLVNDYRINARRAIDAVQYPIKHLREGFAFDRALDITTDRIRAYIARR